jgi:uncharacterized membrane protein YfcA
VRFAWLILFAAATGAIVGTSVYHLLAELGVENISTRNAFASAVAVIPGAWIGRWRRSRRNVGRIF